MVNFNITDKKLFEGQDEFINEKDSAENFKYKYAGKEGLPKRRYGPGKSMRNLFWRH